MQVISLFSGEGGFELAGEKMGWRNILSCEKDKFASHILKYWFPNSYHHDDIYTLTYEEIKKAGFDQTQTSIVVGGFPCQPFSVAGKQEGTNDTRYLWPEMLRVIREVRPNWGVGENVYGLVSWNGGLVLDTIKTDLENEGYKILPFVLPACGVNAPHQRYRVWIVAYAEGHGNRGRLSELEKENDIIRKSEEYWQNKTRFSDNGSKWTHQDLNSFRCESKEREEEPGEREQADNGEVVADSQNSRYEACFKGQRKIKSWGGNGAMGHGQWDRFPTQSPVCGGDDGISDLLDFDALLKTTTKRIRKPYKYWREQSIKVHGNAIVHQVALQIFKTIQLIENANKIH